MLWYEVKFGDVWRTFYKLIKNYSWVLQTNAQHVTCDFLKKKKKKKKKKWENCILLAKGKPLGIII